MRTRQRAVLFLTWTLKAQSITALHWSGQSQGPPTQIQGRGHTLTALWEGCLSIILPGDPAGWHKYMRVAVFGEYECHVHLGRDGGWGGQGRLSGGSDA